MSTDTAAIMSRLEALEESIERQNKKVLDLLARMVAQPQTAPPAPAVRSGKYTTAQYRAMVHNPNLLKELSRQDTSRRRKKSLAASTTPSEASA